MKLLNWFKNLCWHNWQMPAHHLVTIESGFKLLWVVLVCQKCKTIKRIGLANKWEARDTDEPTPLRDYKLLGATGGDDV